MGVKESPTDKGKPKVGFDFHYRQERGMISFPLSIFYYVTVTTWYFPLTLMHF